MVMANYTPMIEQYLKIKAQYQDAFLFFRLGDFYEMFFQDAVVASKELEITLTSRDGGGEERIPMCGVPHHSADNYIWQLIDKGYKVAICEQTEDPKQAKGVVKREVVQLVTPGTVMEGKNLVDKENNYIVAIKIFDDHTTGVALTDLTTGENLVTLIDGSWEETISEIYSSGAKEVVVEHGLADQYIKQLEQQLGTTVSKEINTDIPTEQYYLIEHIVQEKLQSTIGLLLNYLQKTQKRSLDHLQPVRYYERNAYMKIDMFSKRNLELVETIRSKGKKGSLLWLLDKTVTAMGGRRLKQWIERPLIDRVIIEKRLNLVDILLNQFFERQEIREQLQQVYDLERLAGRVAYGNVNGRDLIQLRKSLQQIPVILDTLSKLDNPYITELKEHLDPCTELTELLKSSIEESAPLSIKEGDLIKEGYSEELDRYRDARKNGKEWIAELEQKERKSSGVKSLKIGYNRVFGYYIEVTKANLHLLPDGKYERKQTLANAERFITPDLKEKEALILEAEDKMVELEYQLFIEIREQVKAYIPKLQELAKSVSELDVLQSFATVSEEEHYSKPTFSENEKIHIKDGRHPVVEKVMDSHLYVANDITMSDDRLILLITGPNMSGKSTYMRQVALTSIMAQIGCFVPATAAILPIFDQVFTRIGAADDLVSGQSTFMVEMLEAKNALTNATQNSLILLDEIGRGTSTYDGMALAQAIIEYIHHEIGAKTLFSTHYHELTELETSLKKVKNIHVKAIEEEGKVVFLHKVEEGQADKSYGIHVAKLAELPDKLIQRADEILIQLENQSKMMKNKNQSNKVELVEESQLSFFVEETSQKKKETVTSKDKDMISKIARLELLDMTPMEALNTLYNLQKELKSK